MKKDKVDFSALTKYLPTGSLVAVMKYINEYNVQLTITRKRQSILGDYRAAYLGKGHRISINGDLNKYVFLITLLHEIAHLITFVKYGNKVLSHGKEWKTTFAHILHEFISLQIFPADIEHALHNTIKNPPAASCADAGLFRVLYTHDTKKENVVLVEQLPIGATFTIDSGRLFIKENQLKKRIKCKEIGTGKYYLFSPFHKVIMHGLK